MGNLTTIRNLFTIIGSLYPIFIISFLLLASIFNLKLTGIVYLGGIVATVFICYLVAQTEIIGERPTTAPVSCDFLNIMSHDYKGPSTQAAISWFTFIYLLWPMIPPAHEGGMLNPLIFTFTLLFAFINSAFQYEHGCANPTGIILGIVIGLLMGTLWFFLWWGTNHHDLLFYNELVSNNAICKRPSKQTFQCEVWKGGELISSSTV